MKRVNTFVAMGFEVQESKEKKVEGSMETAKEEDKESDELEEVEEDDEDELKKHLLILIRAMEVLEILFNVNNGLFTQIGGIDREDLEALWRIVKTKYSDIRPEDEFKRVLWRDLKVMFEPDKSYAASSAAGEKITTADYNCLKTFYCQENKDELKR
ncbi:hypothetical protein Tco_1493400 [Tanacetum coccineum]